MANRSPYIAITRGIVVSVETTYLEADSSPGNSHYIWAYRVTIENQGRETVSTAKPALDDYECTWRIDRGQGGRVLLGSNHSSSPARAMHIRAVAPLDTPSGMMGGSYQMESERGERFDIEDTDVLPGLPESGCIAELRSANATTDVMHPKVRHGGRGKITVDASTIRTLLCLAGAARRADCKYSSGSRPGRRVRLY